ncbi:MAG: ABC transporter permease [Candidatus Omnitrophica bacterium]|nr:ABC transporter permease [Candidatus Omnitrophota bacterium]
MQNIAKQIGILIQYRHLILDLAIKDIKVRYRSPVLGFFWAILMPLVTVFIFKFIFSTLMQVQVENYPFFIYLMTAVFPWAYFSTSVATATESIFANRDLIKKTYFPRQIIPVSVVLANLINFLPALLAMILILPFFGMPFTALILLLPPIILLQTILAVGLALIFSSLQVVLRDVKYIVELLLLIWMYLSPVFYPLAMVANFSPVFFKVYLLNPFVGLFCLYRLALLKGFAHTLPAGVNIYILSLWTAVVCICVFFLGFLVFKKYEAIFSDLI